ncbi:MAG: glycosyltransferase family 4 protein [Rhodospirillales bacterium]
MAEFQTSIWPVIAAIAGSFIIAAIGTGLLRKLLAKRGIVDVPNQRSSHTHTTPRGGGLAVVAAFMAGIAVLMFTGTGLPSGIKVIIPVTLFLAAVSWIDDVHSLPSAVRFCAQVVSICASLYFLPIQMPELISGLPPWGQYTLLALAWLWFLNLYNFMDGIDGLTGIQTLTITLGIIFVIMLANSPNAVIYPAMIIAAAMPGFLIWNWPPAKIFMGDVGSVSLGFVLGWLLLTIAGDGFLIPALLIPAYYLFDATLTLIRRTLKGEKIWQAHRQHAYQKAVQGGLSHGRVSSLIGLLGICLIGLSVLAATAPWIAAASGIILTAGLYRFFSRSQS